MKTLALIALTLLVSQAAASPAQLHELFRRHNDWRMKEFPEEAMSRGDYSHADRIADSSLDAIERRHQQNIAFLAEVQAIDRSTLSEEDRVSAELFELDLRNDVAGHQFKRYLAPIGGRFGPQTDIPQMHERVRFKSLEDYRNYLSRLRQTRGLVDDTIAKMKRGLAEGRTPAKVTLKGLTQQFAAILGPALDELGKPFDAMPATIAEADREALRAEFRSNVLPRIRESLSKLGRYVVAEYVPNTRESIAASDWPDGQAFYAHQLRVFTTTDLTARQIHELGLSEVARIRAEMLAVIRRSDFLSLHPDASKLDDNELFKAFVAYLRSNSRFYHTTEEGLLSGYRDICKQIDSHLPRLFGRLPRLPYGVMPMPRFMAPTQTTAYYQGGDIRNAEPGWFVANTYALDQRPRYEMIPLALHEAVPGHHLQVSLSKELEDLPDFRKEAYFVAFGEGWALYSERLGIEMGLFSDPYDDFGRLLYEMWRACRLVVDPGMHALGWSRDQAIGFMLDNTALSPLNIENEVDRYINWPGQACGYKIGELKIRELRAKAEQALGSNFDIRGFHDTILGAGAVPLPVLERRVNDWIKAKQ